MNAADSEATFRTTSPEETAELGAAVGSNAPGGFSVALVGPLGAGKTQLVKGIARGNAPTGLPSVTSPTFTLIHEHPGRLTLYHVDVYRLTGVADLEALGFRELFRPDSLVVVEWSDRVASALPVDTLWIRMTPTGASSRELRITAAGPRSQRCLDALRIHRSG